MLDKRTHDLDSTAQHVLELGDMVALDASRLTPGNLWPCIYNQLATGGEGPGSRASVSLCSK